MEEALTEAITGFGEETTEVDNDQVVVALAKRKYEIVKKLVISGVIAPEDFREAAYGEISYDAASEWLAGNFPSSDEMLENLHFKKIVDDVVEQEKLYNPGEYELNYEKQFTDRS